MPSAQLQRVIAAVKAMKLIGFDQGVAKTVLKKLLKVYENKWEYIEAENYRLLVDSVLDFEESEGPKNTKKDTAISGEPEISRKRLLHKQEDPDPSLLMVAPKASGESLLKRKKMVASEERHSVNLRDDAIEHAEGQHSYKGRGAPSLLKPLLKDGEIYEKGSLGSPSRHHIDEQYMCGRGGNTLCHKEQKIEQDSEVLHEAIATGPSIVPDRPMDESSNNTSGSFDTPIVMLTPRGIASKKSEKGDAYDLANGHEKFSTDVNIASSNMGKVKLSLTCTFDCQDFKMPSIESVFKIVEDRCLKSYKILQPNFSLMPLMKEICQSAADLAAESGNSQKSLKTSGSPVTHRRLTRSSLIGSSNLFSSEILDSSQYINGCSNDVHESSALESSANTSHCLAVLPLHENPIISSSPLHDENDIAKGEEGIRISLINEFTSEKAPPYFNYIPCNVIYQNAHVKISLAQIGEKDCCLNCYGNCLSAPTPCACARKTGGEFVYTINGLLKKEFLNEFIFMNLNLDKHPFYCKGCPIENSKAKEIPDPCKGHLVRKFIKECWSKCGCNKQCGNRVVQRGITHNLQVFYTGDEKGWGLRTLEELPTGSFVCEYVGEILTNRELYDRSLQSTGGTNQIYPVLLDADWGSKQELRDEEALCLDATFYGNVGRFVNHRCFDTNLIEIPVEWETPDRRYYHLAYFTSRKIEVLEELTCDYGVDFKNRTHLIKAFKCCCGSRYCRGSSKTKSRASIKQDCSK